MKNTHLVRTLIVAMLVASLTLFACSDNDDPVATAGMEDKDIVEIAMADDRFETLVTALGAADLVETLKGDGPFTVFAPTDDAFDLLPEGTVAFLVDAANKALLTDILTYHVIDAEVLAAAARTLDGKYATMFNTKKVRINIMEGNLVLNSGGDRQATVVIEDIMASNGVIHVIDAVLDPDEAPKDIVDTAAADDRFETLVIAVGAADLVETLKGEGPFTVFAPTDDAFDLLGAAAITDLLKEENKPALINTLAYHVYDGEVFASDAVALDGGSVTMYNNGSMTINVSAGKVVLNQAGGSPATVVITDIICSNGVIHAIDAVLAPADGEDG
jgi:transforming growth factor-beta-induced protein